MKQRMGAPVLIKHRQVPSFQGPRDAFSQSRLDLDQASSSKGKEQGPYYGSPQFCGASMRRWRESRDSTPECIWDWADLPSSALLTVPFRDLHAP
jgi:hypothetical protein